MVGQIADLATGNVFRGFGLLRSYEQKAAEAMAADEDRIDTRWTMPRTIW